jgi:hypothetical protein
MLPLVVVYVVYFIEVFVFMSRANEISYILSVQLSEYVLSRRSEYFSCISSKELILFITCISLVRPEIAVLGFVVRYRVAVAVAGALIVSLTPKLFGFL